MLVDLRTQATVSDTLTLQQSYSILGMVFVMPILPLSRF